MRGGGPGGARRRRGTRAALAAGALLIAAWAVAGPAPHLGSGGEAAARTHVTVLDGPVVPTAEGEVLFDARDLVPGAVVVAQIQVRNAATTGGPVTLAASRRVDLPAGLPEPLSAVLELELADATNRFGTTILYRGTLAGLGTIPLGVFRAGEARRYRLTVRFPGDRGDAADNTLQGATTTVRFAWTAVLDDPGPSARRR